MEKLFIIIYDDGDCITAPMTWDKDCEGAVEAWRPGRPVALFETRADARRAINISAAKARLDQAQGKPTDTDFLNPCRQFLMVVPSTLS